MKTTEWEKDFRYKFEAAESSKKHGYLSSEVKVDRAIDFIRQTLRDVLEEGRNEALSVIANIISAKHPQQSSFDPAETIGRIELFIRQPHFDAAALLRKDLNQFYVWRP